MFRLPRPVIAAARSQRHFRRCSAAIAPSGAGGGGGDGAAGQEVRVPGLRGEGLPRSPRGLSGIPGCPLSLPAEPS